MEPVKSFKHKQWDIHIDPSDDSYSIFNRGPDGEEQFYKIVPGKYGEPLIVAEPTLAFDLPYWLSYVDAKGEVKVPDQKIAGIICKNGPRLSLSNAKKQDVEIKFNVDGTLQVGSQAYWVTALLMKDKNRIVNYDAFCIPKAESAGPLPIRILELGDLNLF